MNSNAYSSYIPPDLDLTFADYEEDQLSQLRRAQRLRRIQRERDQRLARAKKEAMARKDAEASSDSDVDAVTKAIKTNMTLTPAGSTPQEQELVKVDPAEIGMSVGYKQL